MKYVHWKCGKCGTGWRMSDGDGYLYLITKLLKCPEVGCSGQCRRASSSSASTKLVKATDLYKASNGFGWPHERKCSVKDIKKLLLGACITGLEIEDAGDNRSVIKFMKIEPGPGKQKLVHFGESPAGVVIYKTTEVPYAR